MLGGFGAHLDGVGGEPGGVEDFGEDAPVHVGGDGLAGEVEDGGGEVYQAGGRELWARDFPVWVGRDSHPAREQDAVKGVSSFGVGIRTRPVRFHTVMIGVFDDQIRAAIGEGAVVEVFAAIDVGNDGQAVHRVAVGFQVFAELGNQGFFFGRGDFSVREASGVVDPHAEAEVRDDDFGVDEVRAFGGHEAGALDGFFDRAKLLGAQTFDPFAQEGEAHVSVGGELSETALEGASRAVLRGEVAALHEPPEDVLAGADAAEAVIGEDKGSGVRPSGVHEFAEESVTGDVSVEEGGAEFFPFRFVRVGVSGVEVRPKDMGHVVGDGEDDHEQVPRFLGDEVAKEFAPSGHDFCPFVNELLAAVEFVGGERHADFGTESGGQKFAQVFGVGEDRFGMAGRAVPRDHPAVEGFGRVGEGDIHDEGAETLLAQDLPEGLFAVAVGADGFEFVGRGVQVLEVVNAVFPRIFTREERSPRARGDGWNGRPERPPGSVLHHFGNVGQFAFGDEGADHVESGAIPADNENFWHDCSFLIRR